MSPFLLMIRSLSAWQLAIQRVQSFACKLKDAVIRLFPLESEVTREVTQKGTPDSLLAIQPITSAFSKTYGDVDTPPRASRAYPVDLFLPHRGL